MTVRIFGAGIAGLTVAHELLDQGFTVILYEKLDVIGGFARSRRESDGMPTEHSWRGYAPFYNNFFDIAKRIPLNDNTNLTVYDNLSRQIKFFMPHNNITKRGIDFGPTWVDKLVGGYYIGKCLTSNKRRDEYAQQSFKDAINGKMSKAGMDNYLKSIGPGLGLYPDITSITHITKFVEMVLTDSHVHQDKSEEYEHDGGYHVMKKPTSEAWFDPWMNYLKKKGLILHLNSELKHIQIHNGRIEQCLISMVSLQSNLVNDEYIGQRSDIFVFCINPFEFEEVLENSDLLSPIHPELYKFKDLISAGSHAQPGFRLLFNKLIRLPKQNICFTFPDSEFNITLYPQENFFENDPYIATEMTSLWSGAACDAYTPGPLFNKPAIKLNLDELMQEISYQILRSEELKQLIEQYNPYKFEDLKIVKSEIWYEWSYDGLLKTTNPKWVNTLETHNYRPDQKSNIPNLLLGGAHTKTTVDIWSMEGAVESGKFVAENITKLQLSRPHKSPLILLPFQCMDDILYSLWLPQLIDIIIVIIILMIIITMCSIYNNKTRHHIYENI